MADAKKTYDVAVLGWWYGKNYGSILTYYGLNRAIEGLGRSVLMVHEPLGYNGYRVDWPDDILSMEFARRIGYNYTEQQHFSELPELNDVANTFVVGSDQLWNPLIGRVNDDLFLDFVAEKNNRVAYGTSFGNRGTNKFKPDFIEKHAPNLQRFKAISVRENYAIDTAQSVFGAKASLVVDPVFLLPTEHYAELAEKATFTPPAGEYMTVFFLDPNEQKRDAALAVADKLGFEKIVVVPNPDGGRDSVTELFESDPRVEIVAEDAPENFLRAYRDGSYVITDSYHGTAFAAIFEKPFSSIYNSKRGADRFKNLLGSMGFGETRRIFEDDTPEDVAGNANVTPEIDFTKAREYISTGRTSSLAWLKDALDPEKKASAAMRTLQKRALHNPVFTTNTDAWSITNRSSGTRLRVNRGGAIVGNLAWTALPEPLVSGSYYQMRLDWSPRTTTRRVNLHFRNADTGKFRVIGHVDMPEKAKGARTDTIIFRAPESGLSQFMLGALHFTGRGAGADVRSITIDELPAAGAPTTKGAASGAAPAKGFAGQARALALKDYERQVRSFKHSRTAEGVTGARARMFFHAHAIEKGLTHSNFRPGFGKIAVPGIAKEMNAWLAAGHGTEDIVLGSSAAVMKAYFDRNAQTKTDVSHFWNLFSEEAKDVIENGPYEEGGVLPANQLRERPVTTPNDDRTFMDVMYGRRSVREYTKEPVADSDIATAVQIAMQSPSVCSRQGGRVHQFEDPKVIKQLLDVQGGFVGFEMPPRLLLVTADLDAFLFAPERNQPFVDGGLFMMSLLLGLTQMGLGSCLLNTAMGTEKEQKIRNLVDLPEHEVFIAFVAVGHHDEQVLVPRSKRLDASTVLQLHHKG
ncbi:polysaccharide pyruvyl transferase family protein [Microbacterium halophytorum]|uniref:polysaccharide pyruvyl transferase family protein n=1 Tax=Microbacterium halophytorum TaxID=2067568 RepID=UPI000CFAD8A2|nr:polysaccharide pyruvyl transferase family protein [Microbacterium halophytorum]